MKASRLSPTGPPRGGGSGAMAGNLSEGPVWVRSGGTQRRAPDLSGQGLAGGRVGGRRAPLWWEVHPPVAREGGHCEGESQGLRRHHLRRTRSYNVGRNLSAARSSSRTVLLQ